jgi:hypothetical protein
VEAIAERRSRPGELEDLLGVAAYALPAKVLQGVRAWKCCLSLSYYVDLESPPIALALPLTYQWAIRQMGDICER